VNSRQIIILAAGALFLIGSLLPETVTERATRKPFENQLLARVCLASLGILMMLASRAVT
jgi:hypothetical protein